jgi:release factor glutamine methyltransferase
MKTTKDYRKTDSLENDLIVGWAIKRDRGFVLAHPEQKLSFLQRWKISRAISRLHKGCPLAYILGQKEFFGLNFFVNKNVLIPRPETELIVEEVIRVIASPEGARQANTVIIDVGTGSGCIPIAIMKTLKHENIKTIAIDISRPALRAARKNAKRHNVDIEFCRGNLLEPIFAKLPITNYQLLITANLPYLTREWTESEPSIAREPRLALIADDKNGLSLYEKLFKQINAIHATGQPILILCEIDPRQTTGAINLATKYFPNAQIEIKKDLAGRDRVLKIELV